MNEQNYTGKIPQPIRSAMQAFTDESCWLVSNAKYQSEIGNCHLNVRDMILKEGGSQIFGWLLCRVKPLIERGIWSWQFHSVWSDKNNCKYDITKSDLYKGSKYVTFWKDNNRKFAFDMGVSYNNILICENQAATDIMTKATDREIEVGKIFWTNSSLNSVLDLNDHNGKYKILNGYSGNQKSLEQDYNCKFIDGKIVSLSVDDSVNSKIMFDYSLGI